MPRARSRLIASPSPVPSRVRVSVASTCTNGSNTRASCSGGDPDARVAHLAARTVAARLAAQPTRA